MNKLFFTMDSRHYKQYRTRYGLNILLCRRCAREVQIGEDAVKTSRNRNLKLYHKTCYDSMFIDVDDAVNSRIFGEKIEV